MLKSTFNLIAEIFWFSFGNNWIWHFGIRRRAMVDLEHIVINTVEWLLDMNIEFLLFLLAVLASTVVTMVLLAFNFNRLIALWVVIVVVVVWEAVLGMFFFWRCELNVLRKDDGGGLLLITQLIAIYIWGEEDALFIGSVSVAFLGERQLGGHNLNLLMLQLGVLEQGMQLGFLFSFILMFDVGDIGLLANLIIVVTVLVVISFRSVTFLQLDQLIHFVVLAAL